MSTACTPRRIAVFGLGYVGSVTAACFARLGHQVVGIDRDERKVNAILNAKAPFFEPGLEELIRETVAAGRLSATVSVGEGLSDAEIALLCVGTPSERNGNIALDQLQRVAAEIAQATASASTPLIVAVRSTVFPGTCEDVVLPALRGNPRIAVVSNPEFLREGTAVEDFMKPSLLVVGGKDRPAMQAVADVYASLDISPCLVSLRAAEMIKYACNAFHAVKISFANEIGSLAAEVGVDPLEIMATLCRDDRLNVSAAYLRPGFAFGGSCLPKDLRALVYRAIRRDLKLPLLESILPSNEQHLTRGIREVLDLPGRRIGIFGLTFKEGTDDLRESPAVLLIEHLIGKGREVRVFDPHLRLDDIYGSNRNFIFSAVPHIGTLIEPGFDGLMAWADGLVVTQKPSADLAQVIAGSRKPVIDLARSLSLAAQAKA